MSENALANAELALMEVLWELEQPSTARQIRERLYPDAKRAQHGTVQRLLQRLEDKGYISRDRSEAVQHFDALVSRQAYASAQVESLAERLTGGSLAPLLTHLLEERKISADEILRLRAILEQGAEQ